LTPSAFTVFNIAQVTGANPDDFLPPRLSPEERIPALEEIFGQILPNIKTINGDSAYYSPASDYINMPPFSAFQDPNAYYATLSHELIHWTGNKKRADRPNMNRFGTPEYAFEELVAEIGSAYLMALLGMEATPQKQHAQYLKSWIEILKDDPTAIQRAASQAQKAVDYLIAQSPKLQELSTPINVSQNLVEEA
jgi:antirestriction protein ArdC